MCDYFADSDYDRSIESQATELVDDDETSRKVRVETASAASLVSVDFQSSFPNQNY